MLRTLYRRVGHAQHDLLTASRDYKNSAHATWQFSREMQVGDIVFVKKGLHVLVGRGVVKSDYIFDERRSDDYKNAREVRWTHCGQWDYAGQFAQKTLTDITAYPDIVEKLNELVGNEVLDDAEDLVVEYPPYGIEDFLADVYIDRCDYDTLVALLRRKKNLILQGAPGVGKTYAAKRIAYSVMGMKDQSRVTMIQFHQSYSYEDFVMGFRPSESGFVLKTGPFYDFCKRAEIDSANDYFFIIDEINRGNLSKIFGELFMLIESDKRDIDLQLLYSDEKFSIPENVFIIGMMNTADRSLAMMDYALRRRFAFYELKPAFDSEGFRSYCESLDNVKIERLIACVADLNRSITLDETLGEGFCVGHSYFCGIKEISDSVLASIVEYELIPLLREYWFDEPAKIKNWSGRLREAIR